MASTSESLYDIIDFQFSYHFLNNNSTKLFGGDLSRILQADAVLDPNQQVPRVVKALVEKILENNGHQSEGIFRFLACVTTKLLLIF